MNTSALSQNNLNTNLVPVEEQPSGECGMYINQFPDFSVTAIIYNSNSIHHCLDDSVTPAKQGTPKSTRRDSNVSSTSASSSSSCSSSSFLEDSDDSVADVTYVPIENKDSDESNDSEPENDNTTIAPASINIESGTSSGIQDNIILSSPLKKGKKRKKNPNSWKSNKRKQLKNSGMSYQMQTTEKRVRNERNMKPPCTEKCIIKCSVI